jgi:membrane-bound lytic murein transglycosylase D
MRIFKILTASLLATSLSCSAIAAAPVLPIQTGEAPVPHATNAQDALLITSVEQAYQAGVAAYQAGKGDEARKDFDLAVDTLLQSGRDVKNTPVLSSELDRIVDSINTLQVDALRLLMSRMM